MEFTASTHGRGCYREDPGLKNIFSFQIGISGAPETWVMPDKQYGAILCLVWGRTQPPADV